MLCQDLSINLGISYEKTHLKGDRLLPFCISFILRIYKLLSFQIIRETFMEPRLSAEITSNLFKGHKAVLAHIIFFWSNILVCIAMYCVKDLLHMKKKIKWINTYPAGAINTNIVVILTTRHAVCRCMFDSENITWRVCYTMKLTGLVNWNKIFY